MLKPRAETGGERKSKPAKPRIVNPRFQAQEANTMFYFGGDKTELRERAKYQKNIDKNSKAYKRLDAEATREQVKKAQQFFGLPPPKNGKAYSPAEKKRNAKTVSKIAKDNLRTQKGRRTNAVAKNAFKKFPAMAEQVFGEARSVKSVNKALTRKDKGGGKVNKTGRYAITGARGATEVGPKGTKKVSNALLQQRYATGGKPAKGENARPQRDTRFRGQTKAPAGGKAAPANKGAQAKAQKSQFTKKGETKATREVKPRFTTRKERATRTESRKDTKSAKTTKTTRNAVVGKAGKGQLTKTGETKKPAAPKAPAAKPNTPSPTKGLTDAQKAYQQRLIDNANRKKQVGDDAFFEKGPAPLTTPKGNRPPPIPKDFGKSRKRKK